MCIKVYKCVMLPAIGAQLRYFFMRLGLEYPHSTKRDR